ncbi:MAG: nucleotidyltransferase domain-containing protein [Deltaproteobacteria bacterium]|nr:nucleotidyltransferase domain-containing protein [Deltaproteobacteria bacterium]
MTKYAPEKIILFGSAAKDTDEVNDVDLFIIKDDVPHLGADRTHQLFRLIETDLPVDYLVYRPSEVAERLLGDPFVNDIFKEESLSWDEVTSLVEALENTH